MSDPKSYTFGDNDLAELRLFHLAEAYAESTRGFLTRLANEPARTILDLGCGPGYTTELLARTFSPAQVFGLDSSPRFLDTARKRLKGVFEDGTVTFAEHDVTLARCPAPPANLIFGRFILTHLAKPRDVLEVLAEVSAPRARLAFEETITIESPDPFFTRYYAIVAAMQRSLGQNLNIGVDMPRLALGTAWSIESSTVERIFLPAPVAARLHSLNIRTFRNNPFVKQSYEEREIDALASALVEIAEGVREAPPVRSELRQLVLRRS